MTAALTFERLGADLNQLFSPQALRTATSNATRGRNYFRRCSLQDLLLSSLTARTCNLPGLRSIVEECGSHIGFTSISGLSKAYQSDTFARFVTACRAQVTTPLADMDEGIVILDTMALSVPSSRPSDAPLLNPATRGVGFTWALWAGSGKRDGDRRQGVLPMDLLMVQSDGMWNDAASAAKLALLPYGPLYVMDHGFASRPVLARWIEEGVRVLIRAHAHQGSSDTLEKRGGQRRIGGVKVLQDDVIQTRPGRGLPSVVVRRVRFLKGRDEMVLWCTDLSLNAREILASYRRRDEIEKVHQRMKGTCGLAHLYGFSAVGMETAVEAMLVLMALLWKEGTVTRAVEKWQERAVGVVLRLVMLALRKREKVRGVMMRNTNAARRKKKRAPKERKTNR